MDRPPTPNRVYFDQTLSNALRFIDECGEPRADDRSVICIKCLLESFPVDREFNARAFRAELEPLLDDDLKRFLPGKRSTRFDEDTFAQLAMAQLGREANKLVLTGSKDRYPTYDPRSALTQILAGEASRDPCVDATLPTPLNLLSQSSSQSSLQSLWAPGQTSFGDVAFRSDTYAALAKLAGTESFAFRLSNHTALTRTLSGADLLATTRTDPAKDKASRTEQFFQEHSAAFAGRRDVAYKAQPISQRVFRVQQKSDDGIPVYGGVLIASYDQHDRLTFVNNSCYPIPMEPFKNHFEGCIQQAFEIAVDFVSALLEQERSSNVAKEQLRAAPVHSELHPFVDEDWNEANECLAGRVVLPVLVLDGQIFTAETIEQERIAEATPCYRAAWAVRVVDNATSRSWRVFVRGWLNKEDKTDMAVDNAIDQSSQVVNRCRLNEEDKPVLVVIEDTVGASLKGLAYLTVAHALQGNGSGASEEDIADSDTPQLIDALDFELDTPSANPLADLRVTNAFFHLTIALKEYRKITERAWPQAGDRPTLPGGAGAQRVLVKLDPAEGEAGFNRIDRNGQQRDFLRLPKGFPERKPRPFTDTAQDPEVIYHELTHAVLAKIQPDLQRAGNSVFRVSLDEGLAFYFACSLSDRLLRALAPGLVPAVPLPYRWGKVSRKDAAWTDHGYRDLERWEFDSQHPARQRADHDYLAAYGIFPNFPDTTLDDPDSSKAYAVGMVWARTLWDIRRVLGAELADAVIVRAMHLAGGIQSDLETPAEAIIHVDRELAAETDQPSHESALRLIFASRGIFADSPIRALLPVEIGPGKALLAATESPLAGDSACGCLISKDDGKSWGPLGKNGPRDVVALTWLPTGTDLMTATIWAATEVWIDDASQAPQPQIFRFDLRFDHAGVPQGLDASWTQIEPVLRIRKGVLSLTATHADPASPAGPVWLFVGTEDGIYKFDGAKWPQIDPDSTTVTPNYTSADSSFAVLDLRVVSNNNRRWLLVATSSTIELLEIRSTQPNEANGSSALRSRAITDMTGMSLQSDAGTGNEEAKIAWVGTADSGLMTCDLSGNNPSITPMPGNWQGTGQTKPAVFAVARVPNPGRHTFLAGTNRGLYGRNGSGDWEPISLKPPELANVSILSLCQTGNQWLLGTAQRGLWRFDPQTNEVSRVANGVARLMASDPLPQTNCNGFAGISLPAKTVSAHVITVASKPQEGANFEVQVRSGADLLRVEVFHASMGIDLNEHRIAGVRSLGVVQKTNNAPYRFDLPANSGPGYYLVVVEAGDAETCYSLNANP